LCLLYLRRHFPLIVITPPLADDMLKYTRSILLSRVGWHVWRKWLFLVLMIGFVSTFVTSSLNHIYYSAIADLHTHWSSPDTTTTKQEL
jgi:hypothetical protein